MRGAYMNKKQAKYTFFVDASGDFGVENIRTKDGYGASPYMTLGATLIPTRLHEKVNSCLDELSHTFNKRPHCKNLKHEQKVLFAKQLSQQKILCFGVISLKKTLGSYKDEIGSNASHYHNKCAQYLLENLGLFMNQNQIKPDEVSICFERGPFNIGKLRRLISACQNNPMHPASKYLSWIDTLKIRDIEKEREPLLETADLIAHALYRCVDGGPLNIKESRYLETLKSNFFGNKNNQVFNTGIKPVHKLNDLSLDDDILNFFHELKNNS